MFTRKLGRSNLTVSALGLGCWAIGGPFWRGENPVGWGEVDDNKSLTALQRALDLGITFFDTSDVYGCGHSERILGQGLAGKRDQVVIATKFGNIFDEQTRQITGASGEPDHVRRACEASLHRLQTDYIDLYQFHIGNYELEKAAATLEVLEQLVTEGKIRWYGWSTDDPARAALFAQGKHCAAIQQRFNIFEGNTETLAICETHNLASVNRGPLAMGLLTGKFDQNSQLPRNDVRHSWDFKAGEQARRLQKLAELRNVLTSDGRTLAQAALGWLWARSPVTVPIPGFKNMQQVEENVGALAYGPLQKEQMMEVERLAVGASM
jgi:aryl-alcohol dehydrogenase-like predicted oxidoreductase